MKEPTKRWRGKPAKPEPIFVVVEPPPVSISSTPPPISVPPARVEQSKSMIVATVVMALTSMVMLGVTMHMARTSLHQWEAMRDQVEQTNKVIEQMKTDHEAAKTQATDVISQMKEDRDLVKEQVKQNNAVLKQMQLEQRAWVGVQNPRFIDPKVGKPLEWSMNLNNSGQTPALVERIEYDMDRRSPQGVTFDPNTVHRLGKIELQQSLAPGAGPTRVPFSVTNNVVTQGFVDFIKDAHATDRIYIFGVVHYEDVAGMKRETEFAFVNEPGSYELRLHHKHNRMR